MYLVNNGSFSVIIWDEYEIWKFISTCKVIKVV